MNNMPDSAKLQDDLVPPAGTKGTASPSSDAPLPLRKEAPELPACDPPQKDLSETRGGKITDFFIYKVLGFGANSAASIGVTYGINPTPWAKNGKKALTDGAKNVFKNIGAPERAVNAGMEIFFMLISGTALTAAMAPLVNRREKIAHWVNQKIGKDVDVLPEAQRTYNTPLTLEDKIEQELKKRVQYGQTSRDLWKARWSAILVPLFGDPVLSKWNDKREAPTATHPEGKWSTDNLSWKAGQHLYDKVLPKTMVHKLSDFFAKHGASISEMEQNNKVVFDNLKKYEDKHEEYNQKILGKKATPDERNERMMIADQSRLFGKEVGWTLVLSEIVEKLTTRYQNRRIFREENKAFMKMREEGIIPAGVSVDTDKHGHVSLTTTKAFIPTAQRAVAAAVAADPQAVEAVTEAKKWADDKVKKVVSTAMEKSTSHTGALDQSRLSASQQTSLV